VNGIYMIKGRGKLERMKKGEGPSVKVGGWKELGPSRTLHVGHHSKGSGGFREIPRTGGDDRRCEGEVGVCAGRKKVSEPQRSFLKKNNG